MDDKKHKSQLKENKVNKKCYISEEEKNKIINSMIDGLKSLEIRTNKELYFFIQERWNKEDDLLNTRTGIFLTANAIFFAGAQLSKEFLSDIYIGVTIIGLIVTFWWLLISFRTAKYLKFFGEISSYIIPDDPRSMFGYKISRSWKWLEKIKKIVLDFSLAPTDILSFFLPISVFCSWLSFGIFLWCKDHNSYDIGATIAAGVLFALIIFMPLYFGNTFNLVDRIEKFRKEKNK